MVDIYSVEDNVWIDCPSMKEARSGHSSCFLGEYIYASCGEDWFSKEKSNTIERLRVEANSNIRNGPARGSWELI